jgi:hypothetical protein
MFLSRSAIGTGIPILAALSEVHGDAATGSMDPATCKSSQVSKTPMRSHNSCARIYGSCGNLLMFLSRSAIGTGIPILRSCAQ